VTTDFEEIRDETNTTLLGGFEHEQVVLSAVECFLEAHIDLFGIDKDR
jgi:hypothetical protein